MTLAAASLLSPDRARFIVDPINVARKERRLLEALRNHPGATAAVLAEAARDNRAATVERLTRLAVRGAVERVAAGRWGLVDEEPDEPELDPRAPDPGAEDPSRWVRPIGRYLRVETSPFSCVRFG